MEDYHQHVCGSRTGTRTSLETELLSESIAMGKPHPLKPLAKFLAYILGHRPDEFGLVPDPDGYIKVKDLLKVLSGEEGWRHIRRSHINEILITLPHPPIEISEKRIRAVSREKLPQLCIASSLPKLLYTCIRKRAYAHVLDKGISPMGQSHVILSSTREMAQRIGYRIDQEPILLTVNIDQAGSRGVIFQQAGGAIFLAEHIPAGVFSGPPLPKQKIELKKEDKPITATAPMLPGSFLVNEQMAYRSSESLAKKHAKGLPGRPKDSKKGKKEKTLRERPPWRK